MDALAALRQNGTADEYVNEFKMLAGRADMTDHQALLRYFIKGLRRKLVDKMFSQSTFPEDIDGWYTLAQTLDNHDQRRRAILGYTSGTYGYGFNRASAGEPMDVDRVKVGALTKAEVEEYRRKGLCFYCKEQGHMKNQCPKRSKKQSKEPAKVQTVSAQTTEQSQSPLPQSGNAARIAAMRKIMEEAGEDERTEMLENIMKDF